MYGVLYIMNIIRYYVSYITYMCHLYYVPI